MCSRLFWCQEVSNLQFLIVQPSAQSYFSDSRNVMRLQFRQFQGQKERFLNRQSQLLEDLLFLPTHGIPASFDWCSTKSVPGTWNIQESPPVIRTVTKWVTSHPDTLPTTKQRRILSTRREYCDTHKRVQYELFRGWGHVGLCEGSNGVR